LKIRVGRVESVVYLRNQNERTMITTATLTFPTKENAQAFATAWGRFTKEGHTVGAGMTNVTVTVSNVDDERKEWIENYVRLKFPN
jgi:hypothetical protein